MPGTRSFAATGHSLQALAGRLLALSRDVWHALTLDDRTEYLGRATDLADLERRMRHWDRADRGPR
jgi:hypothetical protein